MAMLLNEFFSSVFTTEDQTNIPSLECQVELMADITIGAAKVQRKLQDLRSENRQGTWGRLDTPQITKKNLWYRWRTL